MLRQLYFLEKKPCVPCLDRVVAQNNFGTFLRRESRESKYVSSVVVCFLLGNYPPSGFYMPTFRNTLSVPSS